jgi:hypothetical protein
MLLISVGLSGGFVISSLKLHGLPFQRSEARLHPNAASRCMVASSTCDLTPVLA